ncbi:MAG TPA: FAD-dependent oxidoreductase, partial [Candidatus Angelobacter sp.]|nr:FAD-dependent oxidoreductase [Candidatus Angelobacter sp.]
MGVHQLPAQDIPVLSNVDLVVIGGSFAGISCALEYANLGKKVMVVESRTYLGSDLTATLSPWVLSTQKRRSKLLQSCLNTCGKTIVLKDSEFTTFHIDQLKLHLEEVLLTAGVQFLYASLPVGVVCLDNNRNGLIIANKSGRQLIRCQGIVDATETAITTFLSGELSDPIYKSEKAYFKRVLEFNKVQEVVQVEFEVPVELGLRSNKIRLYPGFQENGHVYVEYQMLLNAENSLEGNRLRELAAQKQGMILAEYLAGHVPSFSKATLCSSSYELKGPYFFDEVGARPSHQDLEIEKLTLNHPNIWCLYKDFYENGNAGWLDVEQAAIYGEQLANLIKDIPFLKQQEIVKNEGLSKEDSYKVKIPVNFIEGMFEFEHVIDQDIPLSKTAQVLVAGGGSSGGPAAIVSAQQGMSTILVDLNPGLGGTGTFGGVDSYWFGHRHGFAEKIMNSVKEVQEKIDYKGPKWNIEAKKYALLSTADSFGVEMLFNTITFGAITKETRVCGSVLATKWGVCSILSDCVIDATGDGDLAAFAGASFEYGSERDHVVMWYSLAQYKSPGKLQNNFTSMVNVSDIRDYTRAILAGRRRGQPGRRSWRSGKDGCHDHGIYIAPRESRHIIGDVVMTMEDQLLQRKWPDVINI